MFGDRVRECPDAVAVEDADRSLTYRELDLLASRVARRLGALIDGPDRCVGVMAGRSLEAVVAFLGVLRAGAAYVPLDAEFPTERLRFMLEDTGARAVLAQARLADRALEVASVPVVSLDDLLGGTDAVSGPAVAQPCGPRSLAYVMYTSGSSGRPKGVAIEHRGVLRYVRGAHGLIPQRGDRVLHTNQLGFDASTYEIWGALCNGARLVVHPHGRFDPVAVGHTIERHQVTVGFFATGALHQMIDAALPSLGGLRLILAGGDVLSPAHARRLREAHPRGRLINTYGPTEATVTASVHEVVDVPLGRSVPIGRPLANTQLYVLGPDLQPLAEGETGQLCVGGEGVARGYLGLPDLTAERFIPDRFRALPDGRLYLTGDLVRLLPDGDLEFLGRLDDQVKIRGYRVEPGEVTAVLSGHPAVKAAAVVPRDDIGGHRRLVAYVTATYAVDPERLRRYLRHRLPEYMVPSAFVVLDRLPQNLHGKLDRAALPAPARLGHGRAPSTPSECLIAELWGQVLESHDVMADDDFFECGGDSLLALQLLAAIRERVGVELPLDAVFGSSTVATLARRLDAEGRSVEPSEAVPPLRSHAVRDRDLEVPASITQAQACFVTELAAEALPYQAQAVIDFEGQLDEVALHRALQSVVDRHEALRTALPKVRGRRMQEVQPSLVVALPVVDVRDRPDPEEALRAIARERFAERIDIATLPLFRSTLVRLADDRAALIHVEHHVIHDGWSFATFVREMLSLYRAQVAGGPDPLPRLTVQYRDFALWQQAFPASGPGRRQLEYWTQRLADRPPPPQLPVDRPPPSTRSYAGRSLRADLRPELIDALRRAGARSGCTPYMVMVAAFLVLLHRLSGESDLIVGSGLANRNVPGTDAIIGMFVNTVALRVDLSGDPTIDALLAQVRSVTLGALAHQELPFEEVVRALAPERRAGRNPVYEHLFSFHDAPFPEMDLDGLSVRVRDTLSNGSAKADLNVVVVNRRSRSARTDLPDGEEISVVWEFATDVFDEATAARMLEAYLHLLGQMVDQPGCHLSVLELADSSTRARLLAAGGGSVPYERDATIDSVFADRVRDTPDAVAVESGVRRLTYLELDRDSDRLAARLASQGVVRGSCVGVSGNRSLSMVVTLLGILKAGAAYLGIDGDLPASRLRRVLDDAGVRLVCAPASEARRYAGMGVTLIDADAESEHLTVGGAPTPAHTATDLAYVSFTSGSTGEPKGVQIPHRGVVRLVRGAGYVEVGPEEVVLGASPLAFDASTFEIWAPLLNGGRLVIAPPGVLSTAELADTIVRHQVTTAWFTAAIFHQMVDHQLAALSSLHQVLAGGDVLSVAHVNRLLEVLAPGGVVINGYGPTEGTTFTCCHRLPAGTRVEGAVPIGRPIGNSWVAIVDDLGRLVPDGIPGELWIGGDGLACGYAGRPDLTEEQFIPDPFAAYPGGRLYRSGDRVRRRSDGILEFLGRLDRQVKIRGHRVEPAEAEAALVAHPAVAQAHVVPVVFGPDDKRLVAYLVGISDRDLCASDVAEVRDRVGVAAPVPDAALRDFLSAVLPRQMIPAQFVWVAALPLRANGKVDPTRLPAPPSTWFPDGGGGIETNPATTQARPIRGASHLENALVAIWQEVTGVRDVGLDDDFFDLGGHSLLAVELLAAIERTTGARLPLATIFEAPTVARMAALMRSDGWDARIGSLVPLSTSGSRPPLFAVTAGDGNVVGFGPLARRLGPDQPFYVLQPFGIDSSAPLHRTIAAMARHYVHEIRRVQSHGPFLLAGRCFGSLVAYEVAARLEAAGEAVALLVSIDSVGPLWRTRRLANGVVYDPLMNMARVCAEGEPAPDGIFTERSAADEFMEWLAEPVTEHDGAAINRYIHAAYLSRPDLQAGYPLGEKGDGRHEHAELLRWAAVNGHSEMGMDARFLPAVAAEDRRRRASVDPRLQSRRRHAVDRGLDWLNHLTRGGLPPLADRRRADVLRIANENVVRYRAGRLRATVTLIRPELEIDGHQKGQLARWYGLEVGGVEEHAVAGSHSAMLREPAVASLAQCLDRCITAALDREGTRGGHMA
ncbi:MAG: amino acid adenylation domain-containing protein [Candidatus Dormibacteria bacterium]